MARAPQFDRGPDIGIGLVAVKDGLKRLDPESRAHVLAWLCMYYDDQGGMFSPQISRRRNRVTLDGVEYWLVRVPRTRS
jgi:hypothetical protein